MPAIRNACVARGTTTVNGSQLVYTVPANTVLLLKSMLFFNATGGSVNLNVELVASDNSAQVYPINTSVAGNGSLSWDGWTALNAGDTLHIYSSPAGLDYWIAGALLPYNPAL